MSPSLQYFFLVSILEMRMENNGDYRRSTQGGSTSQFNFPKSNPLILGGIWMLQCKQGDDWDVIHFQKIAFDTFRLLMYIGMLFLCVWYIAHIKKKFLSLRNRIRNEVKLFSGFSLNVS